MNKMVKTVMLPLVALLVPALAAAQDNSQPQTAAPAAQTAPAGNGQKLEKRGARKQRRGKRMEKRGQALEQKGEASGNEKMEERGEKLEKRGERKERRGKRMEKRGKAKAEKAESQTQAPAAAPTQPQTGN